MHELLKKDREFNWETDQQIAFETLKERLCAHPILLFPDFEKPFTLTTDASDTAIGAVLSQERENFDHPVSYLSRSLNKAERNYSTTEKECLAVLYALNQFRPYLLRRKFILVADHEPLNWMHNRKDPGQRLMRWMFKFTGYEYAFKYKPGKLNAETQYAVDEPSEEDNNKNLPCLKIMMMKNSNNDAHRPEAELQSSEMMKTSLEPGTTGAKPRPRLLSAPEAPGPSTSHGRGRPAGSKTRKTAARLDHSLIAHRTRMRAAANKQRLSTTSSPPLAGSIKNPGDRPTTPSRAITSSPMASKPLDVGGIPLSNADNALTTPKPKYIDVAQGPRFSQSPIPLLSSTAIDTESEHDTDKPPIHDPRRSCLREEDSDEASGSISEDPRSTDEPSHNIDEPLDQIEINVAPVSESDTTLSKDELAKSNRKFGERLRIHMEKTKGQEEHEEEEPMLELPSHFSEGNEVQDEVQEILNELDPIDPVTRKDDVMTKRIQELVIITVSSRHQGE